MEKKSESDSSRIQRLVLSLGQDLCRAVTRGQWMLPKHVLLCMTLRHMFRRSELITLINKFGHCENYSFSIELETALATTAEQASHILTSQIVRHPAGTSTFHSDFDTFDQLTSSGPVHTAHGIMLQDVDEKPVAVRSISIERTRERSLKVVDDAKV